MITILGARQHFLKNLQLEIPKNQWVTITGPSGSGKSSLAIDTLYAEGQRRYVESLSIYARQFLDQLEKPDVDSIEGLSPAIAIEQRGSTANPRSTVATSTEIYDYLRVLWAACGVPHDPLTGTPLERMTAEDIMHAITDLTEGTKVVLLAEVPNEELDDPQRCLRDIARSGFVRVRVGGDVLEIEEALAAWPIGATQLEIVVDRFVVRPGIEARLADSVETALRLCGSQARISTQAPDQSAWRDHSFQTAYRNPSTGEILEHLTPKHFSFNSPLGACPVCQGLGTEVISDPSLLENAPPKSTKRKLQNEVHLAPCRACGGGRLKREWLAVKLSAGQGSSLGIAEFCQLDVAAAAAWMGIFGKNAPPQSVAKRLADDVIKRLNFLLEVGLHYLALDRSSATLSGGESQRIRLASQLGAGLSGVIYVLDEPSIGLHASDTKRLISALRKLRDLGNTLIVVEHDEEMIRAADWLIDLGPGAGHQGGYLLGSGKPLDVSSPTGEWLRKKSSPLLTRESNRSIATAPTIEIRGASAHNLQDIDVSIPLKCIVCLCGPSGSGKSTLIHAILKPALEHFLRKEKQRKSGAASIAGFETIEKLVVVDQSAIGKSPRSNPATFTGLFDLIRELFSKLPLARQRGYGTARFSFNAHGGRCERCQGNGRLKIEMHFLPDAWIECPACQGKRFNRETLEVTYKGKSISDVLNLTVDDALVFFRPVPKMFRILTVLEQLGLGYLQLGQPANTLSGGEAQRLKLAVELARPHMPHTLYLLDEPTTGLHFGDVERLLQAIRKLRDEGHSILIIEHHLDVISAADWVIELGPGGGQYGGQLIASTTPAMLRQMPSSPTGQALIRQFQAHSPLDA